MGKRVEKMLTVRTLGRIRRGACKGKSIKALSRTLLVSRNTVPKFLRSGATEQTYDLQECGSIEAVKVIEELIQIAKDLRDTERRGEALGLSDDEVAFYDALETNDSAVKVLGDDALRAIACELVATLKNNIAIGCW